MISLIVAYANNQVIGKDGIIPWKIKGEQRRFKELTTGNVVIMGRRSYEEIGKPLPNRTTIVVSNTVDIDEDGCITVKSLHEALKIAGDREVYISGGVRLYEEALLIVDKMYVTEIDYDVDGDAFFPDFDEDLFDKEINEEVEGEVPYKYVTYTRK